MHKQLNKLFGGSLESLEYGPIFDSSGLQIEPVSATITVNMQGTELTIGGTPSVDSVEGTVTYNWSTAEESTLLETLPLLANRARWTINDGSVDHERTQFFDVVAVDIITRVQDHDLIQIWSHLDSQRAVNRSVANSGTTTTFIDTAKRHEPSGFWRGSKVKFLTGGNKGETRVCTVFDGILSEMTLHEALPNAVANGDTYEINSSYQPAIDRAFTDIHIYLLNKFGMVRLSKMVDGIDIRQPHLYLSLVYAGESLIVSGDELSKEAVKMYQEDYENSIGQTAIKIEEATEALGTWNEDSDIRVVPLQIWAH